MDAHPRVADSLVVEDDADGSATRLLLVVVLREGALDHDLRSALVRLVRERISRRMFLTR